jgi:hypothetical protein
MKRKAIISELERNNILGLHESKKVKKINILEQTENANFNKAIQSFLNEKGITDDNNQKLVVDGSIGNYPASKSAQAIVKYQQSINADANGVWDGDIRNHMPEKDKELFKDKISEQGDLYDKFLHWIGMD